MEIDLVCVPVAAVGAARRDDLVRPFLRGLPGVEADLGRPVVVVVVDPADPGAAELMPSLCAAYATTATSRPSAAMVVAHGGVSIYSVDATGMHCHDNTTWRRDVGTTRGSLA